MAKYYLFIAFLTVFVIGIFIIAFSFIGNPLERKAISFDKERVNAFAIIQTEIRSYSYSKGLPQDLSQVPYLKSTRYNYLKDPETQKPYEYHILSNNSYKLCATFSTDSSKQDIYTKETLSKTNNTYKKGYNCLKYQISIPQTNNSYPTRTPTPTTAPSGITCTSTYNGVAHQFKVGEQLCKGFSYTGQYCTTSTQVYTCQPNGKWVLTPCATGTTCTYSPSSTKVSCLSSCTEPTKAP